MVSVELIEEARQHGVKLWATSDRQLRFRGETSSLSDALRSRLLQNESEIVQALSEPTFEAHLNLERCPLLHHYRGLWVKMRSGLLDVVNFSNVTRWCAEVVGPFDRHAFQAASRAVASRHRILSACVDEDGQAFSFRFGGAIAVEQLKEDDIGEVELVAREGVSKVLRRPFGANECLFRPFMVALSDQRHYVGFIINHLIADAATINIVVGDLLHEYASRALGTRANLPSPALQYADYILGMNRWLDGPALEYRLNYWRKVLKDVPRCRLPGAKDVDQEDSSTVEAYGFGLGHRSELVYSAARQLNTTPSYVLLAAYLRVLANATSRPDVAVLCMHHGRDAGCTMSMVGSFQNQIVVKMIVTPREPFEETVRRCVESYSEALQHALPYHYVHSDVEDVGAQEWFPEFNCLVTRPAASQPSTDSPPGAPRFFAYRTGQTRPSSQVRYFPGHKFNLWATTSEIQGCIDYLCAEYSESRMVRFARDYLAEIEATCGPISADPSS